jgi:hypothetical protein
VTADVKLITAILETRTKVPVLGKNARNEFQSYNYVSIDQFYETVKPIANSAGLIWRARMVEWKVNLDLGKHGSVEASVAFDMYHKDGGVIENYMTVPIINSLVGAQTTGQVMSYAEKVFMRAAFGVATGEADADQTDQGAFSQGNNAKRPMLDQRTADAAVARPNPQGDAERLRGGDTSGTKTPDPTSLAVEGSGGLPAHDPQTGEIKEGKEEVQFSNKSNKDGYPIFDTKQVTDKNIGLVIKIFETWMTQPKTKSALRNWYAENVPLIERIKAMDPQAATDITAKFKAQAEKLT